MIKKEMELQALIKDLKTEKSRFNENLYELQDNIRVKYPNEIKQNALIIKHYTDDIKTATSAPKFTDEEGKESYGMKLGEKVYTTRKDAGEALRDILNKNLGTIMSGKELNIGEYRGLKLSILYNYFRKLPQACLRGEKAHYCDLNISTDIGNITRLDNCIGNIQKTIDDLTAKNEARIQDLERMKSDVEKPFEREQELADAVAELEDVHVKLTEFELTDDSAQKDMFERLTDNFTEVLTGQKSYVCYDVHDDNAMPLFVEMQGNILTVGKSFVQNGDLMYSPRVDFTVDYENKKVTPISYEISSAGVYEQFDINDGKPETMKAINEVLTKFDDMMDEIEANGFTAHSESVSEKSRDVVSR